MGRLWGSLFFLFMAFSALSTVLAVFENIICCLLDTSDVYKRQPYNTTVFTKDGVVSNILRIWVP